MNQTLPFFSPSGCYCCFLLYLNSTTSHLMPFSSRIRFIWFGFYAFPILFKHTHTQTYIFPIVFFVSIVRGLCKTNAAPHAQHTVGQNTILNKWLHLKSFISPCNKRKTKRKTVKYFQRFWLPLFLIRSVMNEHHLDSKQMDEMKRNEKKISMCFKHSIIDVL